MYNFRRKISFVAFLVIVAILSSCGGSEGSLTTGWSYNDPELGGFEVADYVEQDIGPGLVFVEGGTFVMGRTQDQVVFNTNNYPRRLTIRSFYMDQVEVANVDYLEYLHWLNRIYGINYPEVYRKALPDTLVWRSKLGYNEPLVETYLRHPAYKFYPVVGVNWLQANDYAKWRTDRVNELRLIERGILDYDLDQQDDNNFNTEAYLAGQYEGLVNEPLESLDPNDEDGIRLVRREDGILLPNYRLPTEAEWEYAALGLIENTQYDRVSQRKTYPWNGNYVRTADSKYYGVFLANFKRGRGDYMGLAGSLNDGADITNEVGSYFPNDFGLFNMGGNVSEWVLDVYRPSSLDDIDDLAGFRGNVFQTKVTDQDGFIATKDSLGRIRYRDISIEEAQGRKNYNKADNINYLDGDFKSTLRSDDNWNNIPDSLQTGTSTSLMYDYGNTSMISDNVRVYKGGSWKDPAYYLSPSIRRFLDQNEATNFIGFRCAMDRVGLPYGDVK
jgi:sulfatase modifying factor 1